MIRILFLSFVLFLAANSGVVAQDGLDKAFKKPPSEVTWGGIFKDFFGNDRYQKSYALIIGVSGFSRFSDLPTQNDPLRMKDFLVEKAGFDHVHVLTEGHVTRERVRELIERDFRGLIEENDRFLLYWSGHGLTQRNAIGQNVGLFPTTNSSPSDIFSMVRMSELSSWTAWLQAEQTLFLFDACFSGHGGVSAQSNVNATLDDMSRPSRHILTAGTANQETFASERLDGGVFTRAILDGLGGLADTSQGGFGPDGIISINELEIYVKQRVREERLAHDWRKPLSPQLYGVGSNEGQFFFLSPVEKASMTTTESVIPNGQFSFGMPMTAAASRTTTEPPVNGALTEAALSPVFADLSSVGWKEVQIRLKLFGLDPGMADGILGRRTRLAFNEWQRQRNFIATDLMTNEQLRLLREETQTAYLEWLQTDIAPSPAVPRSSATQTQAPRNTASPWLDDQGCLREPDGSFVTGFLDRCS